MENIQIQATNDLLDIEDSQDIVIFQPYKLLVGNKRQRLNNQASRAKQRNFNKQKQLIRNTSSKLKVRNKTSCSSYRDGKQNSTSRLKSEDKNNQHTSSKQNLKFALQRLTHAGKYQQYGQKQTNQSIGKKVSMKRLKTAMGIREQSSKTISVKRILKSSNQLNNAIDVYAFNKCSNKYPSHNYQAFLSQEASQQDIFRPIISRQKSSNTTLSTMTKLSFHEESQKIRKFIKRKIQEKTEIGIKNNKDKKAEDACLQTRQTKSSHKGNRYDQNGTKSRVNDNKMTKILAISQKNTPKISKSSKVLKDSRSPKFRLTVKCRGKQNIIDSQEGIQTKAVTKHEKMNLRDMLF